MPHYYKTREKLNNNRHLFTITNCFLCKKSYVTFKLLFSYNAIPYFLMFPKCTQEVVFTIYWDLWGNSLIVLSKRTNGFVYFRNVFSASNIIRNGDSKFLLGSKQRFSVKNYFTQSVGEKKSENTVYNISKSPDRPISQLTVVTKLRWPSRITR